MKGRPAKPDPLKYCAWCVARITRRRYGARLEDLTSFLRRRYCNRTCFALGQMQPSAPLPTDP